MITEVTHNIFRIRVPLPNNPLKETNAYLIRGGEGDLLVDTGFRCEESEYALRQGLAELDSLPERRDVFVTHLHSDHMGLADLFAGKNRHIFINSPELEHERAFLAGNAFAQTQKNYVMAGFPESLLADIFTINPAVTMAPPRLADNYRGLSAGDHLSVGEYDFQIISVPGHTPGNTMLWDAAHRLLLTGDHILFDITPNITAWPGVLENALGRYLSSLQAADAIPVELALPGHRESGDYHARIAALQVHHAARLDETLRIVKEHPGLPAYEIASLMTWRIRAKNWAEFPPVQKWFAVGECIAHLDYLSSRSLIRSETRGGINRYFCTRK